MATPDQLEIISVSGEIQFYDLDPNRGITNIGRHPENDIILDSPGVGLFHAMLDHRQKPYQLLILSPEAETIVSGQLISPNVFRPLQNWDNIQMDGYTLLLVEGSDSGVSPGPVIMPAAPTSPRPPAWTTPTSQASAIAPALPGRPASFAPPPTRPELPPSSAPSYPPYGAPAPAAPPVSLATLPPDHIDDIIVAELSEREWTIEVDQTVTCQLTLINGGDIVAMFAVSVEGLPESWVTISQPYVNLNEGERTSVTIALSAPRLPTSRAGAHHFAIVVTSPNYASRYSQRGATLNINPYYDFAVGELQPKQQTISWFKRSGQATLSIVNKGNSTAPFRLEGANDERACSFEFQVPGEEAGLAQQAELQLPSEESIAVPVQVTPHSRRLFGFRKRTYAYTITTTPLGGQQTPRSLLGQLSQKPLIGPWLIVLLILLLLILIIYIFRPAIYFFSAEPRMIRAGEEVVLRWQASPFASLRINGEVGPVEEARGEKAILPQETLLYEIRGDNFLSWLIPFLSASRTAQVEVDPVKPVIRVFSVDRPDILTGESATLAWEVINADDLILQVNGAPENLRSEEHSSTRTVSPVSETTYVMVARNRFGEDSKTVTIRVNMPTATPIPTPLVRRFTVDPQVIVAGESVLIEWEVEGADSVEVQPLGSNLPPSQSLSQSPQQNTNYVLNAANGPAQIQPIIRQVIVNTPTPGPTATPTPAPPVIDFFLTSDDEIVKGDVDDVDLTWSVSGPTTDIQLSGPGLGTITNLGAQGLFTAPVDETTTFVLTALNGEVKVSANVQVKVLEPTPTTTPVPTATPLPTATPTPPLPIIVFFRAAAASSVDDDKIEFVNANPQTYEVVAGTKINLSWEVQQATKATLFQDGTSLGDQPLNGSSPQTIRTSVTYRLSAFNADNKQVDVQIRIEAQPDIPPAPFNVNGIVDPGVEPLITIEWGYDNQDENRIEGFRLYRADNASSANFRRIADEKALQPGSREYEDEDLDQTCGKAYYVVAVYEDVDGNLQETDASANSWFSPPCQ